MVATRFGTFFGTLNFVRFGTNFFCFGTAIGTAIKCVLDMLTKNK
jgi:hypothetical protein